MERRPKRPLLSLQDQDNNETDDELCNSDSAILSALFSSDGESEYTILHQTQMMTVKMG